LLCLIHLSTAAYTIDSCLTIFLKLLFPLICMIRIFQSFVVMNLFLMEVQHQTLWACFILTVYFNKTSKLMNGVLSFEQQIQVFCADWFCCLYC